MTHHIWVSLSQKEIMILFINYLVLQHALDLGPARTPRGTSPRETPPPAAKLDTDYHLYILGEEISIMDNQENLQ